MRMLISMDRERRWRRFIRRTIIRMGMVMLITIRIVLSQVAKIWKFCHLVVLFELLFPYRRSILPLSSRFDTIRFVRE